MKIHILILIFAVVSISSNLVIDKRINEVKGVKPVKKHKSLKKERKLSLKKFFSNDHKLMELDELNAKYEEKTGIISKYKGCLKREYRRMEKTD